jgi:putative colanic acid biosynthesis glycosyltransferase WcaI
MHLLIIGINFAPELTGVGRYTGEMAAWLAGRGHDVSVVTTRPYYPEWRRGRGAARFTWGAERWRGCRVVRCPLYVPRQMSGTRRILHLGSFALSSIPPALLTVMARPLDVVLGVVPTLLSAPLALAAARMAGARAWLHVQDLEIDAAAELGLIKNARLIDGALGIERWLTSGYDLVSTISPAMLEALERKNVARDRLALFPNWVDTTRFFPMSASSGLRRELGVPDGMPVVLYSGSMGRKQGLETVVAAARLFAREPAESPLILLAGAGPGREELERAAAGLPNLRFLPLQPEERFNEFLNVGDIHLMPQRRDAADLVMPSKLGAVLAAGKPVIATVPPSSQIARTLGPAGSIVPPEDPERLAYAIRELAGEATRRTAMGAAARRIACESLEAETVLAQMEGRLLRLVDAEHASVAESADRRERVDNAG